MPDYTLVDGPVQVPRITLRDAAGKTVTPLASNGDQVIDGALTANAFKVGTNQVVGARQAAIPNPSEPGTLYAQAEANSTQNAVVAILAALRAHGLIAP